MVINEEWTQEPFEVERLLETDQGKKDLWNTYPIWYIGRSQWDDKVTALVSLHGGEGITRSVHSVRTLRSVEVGQTIDGESKKIVRIEEQSRVGDGLW